MLDIPEGTVASRLYRAHQRLRETWTDAGRRRRTRGEM
jgi:DNA-directed RNA polymerase specialized sigma24 family protein